MICDKQKPDALALTFVLNLTCYYMILQLYSTVTLQRGEKHYTNKVDVYSFGIILLELLANKMPFEGMSNLKAAYAVSISTRLSCLQDRLIYRYIFST